MVGDGTIKTLRRTQSDHGLNVATCQTNPTLASTRPDGAGFKRGGARQAAAPSALDAPRPREFATFEHTKPREQQQHPKGLMLDPLFSDTTVEPEGIPRMPTLPPLGSFDTDAVATCTFDNIHEAVLTRRLAKVRR